MKTAMLGLLAETSVHPGSGRGMGVVDLPVAREAATDYPVLVGSSLKGALKDKAKTLDDVDSASIFGVQDKAGELLISDGRLLLLPVRSLMGAYRWATCPHILERYSRDLARSGLVSRSGSGGFAKQAVDEGGALSDGDGELFLEERQFSIMGDPSGELVKSIKRLILHENTRARLGKQIAVLHDDDFAWFVRYGLSIQARNVLEDGTKKSKNLWYEETLPPDTVMYTLIAGRTDNALKALDSLFPDTDPYLQVGGNHTVGQGWFAVRRATGGEEQK